MKDYKIQNDIVLENGDYVFVKDESATVQRLRQKLNLWKGEWFLNKRAGVPWLEDVLRSKSRPALLRTLFFNIIQQDPGVRKLESLEILTEKTERRLSVNFKVQLIDGTTEEVEV